MAAVKAIFLLALMSMASPVAVPALPGGTGAHLENAKAGQADFAAFLEMSGGQRHQAAQDGFGLLPRHVMALGQFGGHLPERDGAGR